MLVRIAILERIKAGGVSLAFRRWRRPTVRSGGTLRTAVGVLAIEDVSPVDAAAISLADARMAGFGSLDALLADVGRQREGEVYRIALRFAGEDPRIGLRSQDRIEGEELKALEARLQQLDARAESPWTARTLRLIATQEERPAAELAATLGLEKMAFKRKVRGLKELGLTESLEVGYRLSKRGRFVLARLVG